MISRIDVSTRPSAKYENPSPPGAATDQPRAERHASETDPTAEASSVGNTGDATAEVLADIYSAPLSWRVTVASALLALAILAAIR